MGTLTKLLVVDDTPFIREATIRLIRGLRPKVGIDEAANALQFMEMARANRYAVAFVDDSMGVGQMKGTEAIRKLRDEENRTPMILFSTTADECVAKSYGADGAIVKGGNNYFELFEAALDTYLPNRRRKR